MNIGKEREIKQKPVRTKPQPVEKPIKVPNWPTKKPVEVPRK
jgi:hypothetical protein